MDGESKKRARSLVGWLNGMGRNSGFVVKQDAVVLRSAGTPYTDTPQPAFDPADVQNAVALDLLEKRRVTGSFQWEWFCATGRWAGAVRKGQTVVLLDGSKARIMALENSVAFYGEGNSDHVPLANLLPARSGEADEWEVDPSR